MELLESPCVDVESLPWPVFTVDHRGVVISANPVASTLAGGSANGLNLARLCPVEEGTAFQGALSTARSKQFSQCRILWPGSGKARRFNAQISHEPREGQDTFTVLLIAMPEEAGSTLSKELNDAYKHKLDCALHLTESIAADFNNVLTSILGHTSLALRKADRSNPCFFPLAEIEKAAEKAAEITTDLANFSRRTPDRQAIVTGNLNELLRRVINTFETDSKNHAVWIHDFARDLLAVRFDEGRIQQAIVKIFDNAVQATGENRIISVRTRNVELTEPQTVGVARLSAGHYACLEIRDNGTGIEPALLPRVFEPFYTTKDSSRHKGLGLTWVYGVVANHAGSVAIENQNGVAVKIYLPAQKSVARASVLPDGELQGTETVLLVDDEELIVSMASAVLKSYGYNVISFTNPWLALEAFERGYNSIDLVITDLVMPDLSGRELIQKMRVFNSRFRSICMTGFIRVWEEEENREFYLRKPFSTLSLLQKVRECLK